MLLCILHSLRCVLRMPINLRISWLLLRRFPKSCCMRPITFYVAQAIGADAMMPLSFEPIEHKLCDGKHNPQKSPFRRTDCWILKFYLQLTKEPTTHKIPAIWPESYGAPTVSKMGSLALWLVSTQRYTTRFLWIQFGGFHFRSSAKVDETPKCLYSQSPLGAPTENKLE